MSPIRLASGVVSPRTMARPTTTAADQCIPPHAIRGLFGCRAVAALALFAVLWVGSAVGRDAEYDVTVESDQMVSMRDGTRLATDVYRPARDGEAVEGRFPTILTRTPYNKNGNARLGNYYAARGYVFVAQDTRGRYGSEGVWHMLTDDGPDGVDCAEWIATRPWSDGQIGMIGTSYVGGTQHALAMAGSPHLKTIIPVDAMSNLGYASMRNGGAFELRFWNWIMLNAGRGSRAARDPGTAEVLQEMADQRFRYLSLLPLRPGTTPLRLSPEYESWLVGGCGTGRTTNTGNRTTFSITLSVTVTFRSTWSAAGTTRGGATRRRTSACFGSDWRAPCI